MPKYSVLMQVSKPNRARLDAAVDSLVAQSQPDWELVIVGSQEDLLHIGPFGDSRIRTALGQPDELLPWVANRLLPTLGTWVGFLGQSDRLAPDTLEKVDLGIAANPLARVVYTDEESRSKADLVTMRYEKGAINPTRLRHQEYIRDFVVIDRAFLQDAGGFDRLASDSPTHDLYLRTLEARGPAAFLNIPHRLYLRHRNHQASLPAVDHDLHAVRQHLARGQVPATVRQLDGSLDVHYRYADNPWVTVVIVVGDDVAHGLERIHRSQVGPVYRPASWVVLHRGHSVDARRDYESVCSTYRMAYRQDSDTIPALLNQEAQRADGALICFLQAEPINDRWLHRLVDHARIPDIGVVGPRLIAGRRLTQPGVLGYLYDGWDWNTPGRFNALAVPHQISVVSPACMLVDLRRFLSMGGFDASYPGLYGMELCLRMDEVGYSNILVPGSQAAVVDEWAVSASEAAILKASWSGWKDRFNLHQSF